MIAAVCRTPAIKNNSKKVPSNEYLPKINGATEVKRTVTDKLGLWKDKRNPTVENPNERKVYSGGKEYHAKTYFGYFSNAKQNKFKATEFTSNGQTYRYMVEVNGSNEPTTSAVKQVVKNNGEL